MCINLRFPGVARAIHLECTFAAITRRSKKFVPQHHCRTWGRRHPERDSLPGGLAACVGRRALRSVSWPARGVWDRPSHGTRAGMCPVVIASSCARSRLGSRRVASIFCAKFDWCPKRCARSPISPWVVVSSVSPAVVCKSSVTPDRHFGGGRSSVSQRVSNRRLDAFRGQASGIELSAQR